MQACPLRRHLHRSGSRARRPNCHYCAHRTDIGLEPACVVVCPEHAIIAGDMNDPPARSAPAGSPGCDGAQAGAGHRAKLFYIEGSDVAMHPTATERAPQTFCGPMCCRCTPRPGMATTTVIPQSRPWPPAPPNRAWPAPGAAPGTAWQGPIQLGGTMAEQMVQVGYNFQHKIPGIGRCPPTW